MLQIPKSMPCGRERARTRQGERDVSAGEEGTVESGSGSQLKAAGVLLHMQYTVEKMHILSQSCPHLRNTLVHACKNTHYLTVTLSSPTDTHTRTKREREREGERKRETHTHLHTHTHTCIYTHIYIRTHTYTDTCTHTFTPPPHTHTHTNTTHTP